MTEKFDDAVQDPAVVESTNHSEPLDSDSDGKGDAIETFNSSKEGAVKREDENKHALARAKSYATTTSAVSRREDVVERKPWYKKMNPLKWRAPPPVPETRAVSREYTAGFLSQLYFQWVSPIMSVRKKYYYF